LTLPSLPLCLSVSLSLSLSLSVSLYVSPRFTHNSSASEDNSDEEFVEKQITRSRNARRSSTQVKRRAGTAASRRSSTRSRKRVKQDSVSSGDDDNDNDNDSDDEQDDNESDDDLDSVADGKQHRDLFAAVKLKGVAIKSVAASFVKRFQSNESEALVDIVNFMLLSCGSTETLSAQDIAEDDRADLIERISKQSKQLAGGYPIVSRKAEFKKFSVRLREFLRHLVLQCPQEVLTGDVLIPHMIDWLKSIAFAALRSFRHTASVMAFDLISALITVISSDQKQLQVKLKQLQQAQASKRRNRSKMLQLQDDVQSARSVIRVLRDFIDDAFKGVFINRARDSQHSIRALCMSYMAKWLSAFPGLFLSSSYIKYALWGLNDAHEDVRRAAVGAIHVAYKNQGNLNMLDEFTQRFLERFFAMTNDKDDKVAAAAIDLVMTLLQAGLLDENDGQYVALLMWDKSDAVSTAAARFAYEDIFAEDADVDGQPAIKNDEEKRQRNLEDLHELLNFFHAFCPETMQVDPADISAQQQAELEPSVSRISTLFIEQLACLTDWTSMIDLLIAADQDDALAGDNGNAAEAQKVLLAQFFVTSAWHVTQQGGGTNTAATAADDDDEQRQALSKAILPRLSELLTVFQTDVLIMQLLVRLAEYVLPSTYSQPQQKKHYTNVIKALCTAFVKHSDETLLASIASSLRVLTTENDNNPLASQGMSGVRMLASSITEEYKTYDQELAIELTNDDCIAMLAILRRRRALYGHMDLEQLTPNNDTDALLGTMLERLAEHGEYKYRQENNGNAASAADDTKDATATALPVDEPIAVGIVENLLQLAYIRTLRLHAKLNVDEPSESSIDQVRAAQSQLLGHVEFVLKQNSILDQDMVDRSCDILVDVWIVSSSKLRSTTLAGASMPASDQLKQLYYEHFERMVDTLEQPGTDIDSLRAARVKAMQDAGKLVLYDTVTHVRLGSLLLSYFGTYGNECDAVIKITMNKLREKKPQLLLDVQLDALKLLFDADPGDTAGILQIANRFALSHAIDPAKRSFATFLIKGVQFATTGPAEQMAFLSLITPFVKRSSLSDVLACAEVFFAAEKRIREELSKEDEVYASCLDAFKTVLRKKGKAKAAAGAGSTAGTPTATPQQRRQSARRPVARSRQNKLKLMENKDTSADHSMNVDMDMHMDMDLQQSPPTGRRSLRTGSRHGTKPQPDDDDHDSDHDNGSVLDDIQPSPVTTPVRSRRSQRSRRSAAAASSALDNDDIEMDDNDDGDESDDRSNKKSPWRSRRRRRN
jgi:STAG domain/Stromalin conservative domain